MNTLKRQICLYSLALTLIFGCSKQNEWLEVKPQSSLVVPETLNDFQALLDNPIAIHNAFSIYGLVGADNIYLTDIDYNSVTEAERNGYLWSKNIWINGSSNDWNNFYKIILYANVVLDGLQKKGLDHDQNNFNNVKGQALFYRAISYYNLAQLFCKQYASQTSGSDLGLPIKLTSDVNILRQRSTLEETYSQIINDVKTAIDLLPAFGLNNRRPNKISANALLAKIYLVMEDYSKARFYANEALKLNDKLLDFNSSFPSLSLTYRFPANGLDNPEILFYAQAAGYTSAAGGTTTKGFIVRELYDQYQNTDLRKQFFFIANGTEFKYRGTYTGLGNVFCGISNNEVYLIRAESSARLHDAQAAIDDLNTLLRKRYRTGNYVDYSVMDEETVLRLILSERRKELPFVGNLRWEDLRRLNKDERFKRTLSRRINGLDFTLDPGSPSYVFPIPDNEIQISGLVQNPR